MKTPSIRASLVILVLGCVVPMAAVAAFLIVDFYGREQTRLTGNAIGQARAMMSAIDRDFARIQVALEALGTSHRLASGDLKGFHNRAQEVLKVVQADSIAVVDASGQLLLSTHTPFGEALPALDNAPLLKRVLETGKPSISDVHVGPVPGRYIYTVAVPVKRDGAFLYLLHATAQPTQLSGVLTEQKLPEPWRASIVDSTGTVVARTHDLENFLGKKVSLRLMERLANAAGEGFETSTVDGIPMVTIYSRSAATQWSVVLGMPLEELTQGLRQTLSFLILATISALGLGIALAWFIGGRVARSITALTHPTVALAGGEAAGIPPQYFEEANVMGHILQQATYDAQHDTLTGLANRALFHLVVTRHLALCQRNGAELAILYVDLDGFKSVNDSHGHAVGDQLLRMVSTRILGATRDADFAARLGGDEFAVALVHSDLENATTFALRLIDIVSEPYQLGPVTASVSASIGVSAYPASATSTDLLLQKADQAMYQAKALGKRRCCVAT